MYPKSVVQFVIVVLRGSGMAFSGEGLAQAAPGGVPGSLTWSHEGGQSGCGNAEISIPSESPAYYSAHPDQFVIDPNMPSGMKAELEEIALNQPTVLTSMTCTPGQMRKPTNLTSVSSDNGAYAVLPNFGTITLTGAGYQASGASTSDLINSAYPTIIMNNTSGQVLASPGTASSSGSFSVVWRQAS